ncbi:sucrose-6-phosphate hydrolase [Paenibacillus campi]|uniref:glycoside hydrolase family 32 protein n=1 Tax=Paenibacillus campi TaxID=3106031 RepID=UPI002AFF2659|nr:sucrose-6-phosphate hydrolase [Paenibacillus sp. SGZ-1014]
MKMTREQKYRLLDEVEQQEIEQLLQKIQASPWRQQYHIQPTMGLLNDPNGFAYYDGYYHLFYQWFPLGTDHGMKYWYHLKSTDLVNWIDCGIGVKPGDWFDSHGAYSGSGIEYEGKLYLMYTGNTRNTEWQRHPYQCVAMMDQNGHICKLEQPVIAAVPAGYTEHFRDPKVWRDGDSFYCVIGAQRSNLSGAIVMYRSPNMVDWELLGELETALPQFGYMWECPDYWEMNGQAVLLFCPQGLAAEGEQYRNIYQSGYVSGKPLALPELKLEHGSFRELDYGFDFYAPQTTTRPDGRRILVGWMGLPDTHYPTDGHGWAHCLTLPRELELRADGVLLQKPVPELALQRGKKVEWAGLLPEGRSQYDGLSGITYELDCRLQWDANDRDAGAAGALTFGLELRTGEYERTVLRYEAGSRRLTLDRSLSGQPFAEAYGTTRTILLERELERLHLFVDVSSVEIFVNDGEAVLTSRIFPQHSSQGIVFVAEAGQVKLHAEKWEYPSKQM